MAAGGGTSGGGAGGLGGNAAVAGGAGTSGAAGASAGASGAGASTPSFDVQDAIDIPQPAVAMAYDDVADNLWFVGIDGGTGTAVVAALPANGNTVAQTVPLTGAQYSQQGLVVIPELGKGYVGHGTSVLVIDLVTGSVESEIATSPVSALAVDRAGRRVFVAVENGPAGALLVVDATSDTIAKTVDVAFADGGTLWLSNVNSVAYDPTTSTAYLFGSHTGTAFVAVDTTTWKQKAVESSKGLEPIGIAALPGNAAGIAKTDVFGDPNAFYLFSATAAVDLPHSDGLSRIDTVVGANGPRVLVWDVRGQGMAFVFDDKGKQVGKITSLLNAASDETVVAFATAGVDPASGDRIAFGQYGSPVVGYPVQRKLRRGVLHVP